MRRREAELLRRAHEAMLSHFGPLGWWPAETPFEVLVGAVLTQNAAWTRVALAIENLSRSGLLDAARLHRVPEAELAELIRPAGTFGEVVSRDLDRLSLVAAGEMVNKEGVDETNLAEIHSPEFPGERLVACFNPLLADERGRKREELLAVSND